jgi:membrane protease YdiL (CAAX protease family)
MTAILWVLSKLVKGDIIKNKLVMWSSIIIAALVFGLGHLPITSSLIEITPLVVLRALVLNGIGGVVFGRLYWKKGLEAAMIAHFSADIIIQVGLPLLFIIIS